MIWFILLLVLGLGLIQWSAPGFLRFVIELIKRGKI
jgi:hypothetical protein